MQSYFQYPAEIEKKIFLKTLDDRRDLGSKGEKSLRFCSGENYQIL